MSHGITAQDNMFSVRETAWHGLGETLSEYPTRDEAQSIAHPWEPVSEPIYQKQITVGDDGEIRELYVPVEGHKLMTRDDTNAGLGVVGESYEPVSNTEMYDIAEAIQGDADDVLFETGGSINGGRKVWLLLRLAEPLKISADPETATIPYFGLQNSFDGTSSFKGQALATRIVCQNTMQMADLEAQRRRSEFTFRHTASVKERIEQAKEALAGWRENVDEYARRSEALSMMPVTAKQRELFVTTFIPAPAPGTASERVFTNVDEAQQTLRGILNGETCAPIKDNAYGLVQASVEYLQHYRRAFNAETRFNRSFLNDSAVQRDAVKIAEHVAA